MSIESALMYEQIMNDPDSNYKVTIGGLQGGSVSGVLNAPMPIAGGNEFQSIKTALSSAPLFGSILSAGQTISDVLRFTGNDTSMSVEQTRKIWQESRVPQLSVELTFWQIDSSKYESPMSIVNRIYSALFPQRKSEYIVSAPMGYKFVNKNGDATGTLNLSIGRFFMADGLVMVDANFTPSLEVGYDGTPLYLTGTVTLEPYKMITYEDYLGWFKKTKSGGGGGGMSDKASSMLNDALGTLRRL